jgi:hypothetical protein
MTALRVIFALVLGSGAAAIFAAKPDLWLVQFQLFSPNMNFSADLGPERPTHVALNSEREWKRLWAEIEPRLPRDMNQTEPHPFPPIDFKRHTLIAAAMGEKPTSGYSVAIRSITEMPTQMLVSVIELQPGDSCMAVTLATTRPVALALIPRTKKPVRFDVVRTESICE